MPRFVSYAFHPVFFKFLYTTQFIAFVCDSYVSSLIFSFFTYFSSVNVGKYSNVRSYLYSFGQILTDNLVLFWLFDTEKITITPRNVLAYIKKAKNFRHTIYNNMQFHSLFLFPRFKSGNVNLYMRMFRFKDI